MATIVVTVSLVDYKGDTASVAYHIVDTATDADVAAWVVLIGETLDAITGALITGVTVTTPITAWGIGLKTEPADGVDMERGVNFGYSVADSQYRHTIRVPAIDPALGDGEEIDPDPVPQGVYNNWVVDGNLTCLPSSRDGLDLDGVIDPGLITFHKAIK